MLIPTRVHQLDETSATLDESTSQKTVPRKGSTLVNTRSIQVKNVLRFIRDISQFGNARLHSIGHLVLRDTGRYFRITNRCQFLLIERRDAIEHLAPQLVTHPLGILQIQHRAVSGPQLHPLMMGWQKAVAPVGIVENLTT